VAVVLGLLKPGLAKHVRVGLVFAPLDHMALTTLAHICKGLPWL
jgi:hypothetical protein